VQFLIKSGIQQTQESGGRSLASSNSKDSIWQAAKCCKVATMRRLFACLSFCATRMGHSTECISVLSGHWVIRRPGGQNGVQMGNTAAAK